MYTEYRLSHSGYTFIYKHAMHTCIFDSFAAFSHTVPQALSPMCRTVRERVRELQIHGYLKVTFTEAVSQLESYTHSIKLGLPLVVREEL